MQNIKIKLSLYLIKFYTFILCVRVHKPIVSSKS